MCMLIHLSNRSAHPAYAPAFAHIYSLYIKAPSWVWPMYTRTFPLSFIPPPIQFIISHPLHYLSSHTRSHSSFCIPPPISFIIFLANVPHCPYAIHCVSRRPFGSCLCVYSIFPSYLSSLLLSNSSSLTPPPISSIIFLANVPHCPCASIHCVSRRPSGSCLCGYSSFRSYLSSLLSHPLNHLSFHLILYAPLFAHPFTVYQGALRGVFLCVYSPLVSFIPPHISSTQSSIFLPMPSLCAPIHCVSRRPLWGLAYLSAQSPHHIFHPHSHLIHPPSTLPAPSPLHAPLRGQGRSRTPRPPQASCPHAPPPQPQADRGTGGHQGGW